jgi:predicted phosphodiesterase
MKRDYPIISVLLILLAALWACENPFSFSPFEANIPKEFRNTTEKNLQKIALLDSVTTDSIFHVAVISDAHFHLNSLRDAISDINSKGDFSFVIVVGDITENGLQKEFELFHSIMNNSKQPYLTVIGNHDYLSNGEVVYQQIFGPVNYSFTFQNVKFVMWDNILWESNKTPDWEWLKQALTRPTQEESGHPSYHHIIPFAHIPPFDGQLLDSAKSFHGLLRKNGVKFSVHGHKHEYSYRELQGDGILCVTVGSPQHRHYTWLTITPGQMTFEKIEY